MACTDNDEYADRMRIMSLHGISKDAWKRFTAEGSWYYEIVAPGYKYNMTDIAAAIGIHQLRRADELHQKRRNIAALYTRLLGEVDELILPREMPNRIHSWHLYAIRLKLDRLNIDRAQVIQQMKEHGTMKARPGSWPCGLAMCSVPPVVWSRSSSARSPKAARSP
jgi:perosamine synthetase